ncbi:putative Methyl-accepting chemotaxis protein [Magnetospirillum gryphiswaldense MSR-1 v2]|uniref:Methyl-accepting chemotaxis protein n=2 Tax=Magnetospirillum gryphiswaldense TaxID=55518 RepID=V6F7E0_MAGGM|nr:putative Methyl-accepting chemotaxis protein [Magnetospirillum gryphiswaldense MSR-1 v2]
MLGSRFDIRRSLKARFAVSMALLLAVIFTVTGVAMVRNNADERLALVEQRGRLLVSMQADSLIAPVWNVYGPQIDAVLAACQRDPAVEQLRNEQVADVQLATRQAMAAIEDIGRTIADISTVNTTIASAVEEQQAATREIARNVDEAAGTVLDDARQLSATAPELNREVQGFLARVDVT